MKPGLYVATVRGVEGVIVARFGDTSWHSIGLYGGSSVHGDSVVTDARPLVVLDPESGDDCAAVGARLSDMDTCQPWSPTQVRELLRALAAPTPAEPMGLGAVVRDATGGTWVRNPAIPHTRGPWVSLDGRWFTWSDLDVAEVLSEGWSE